VSTSETPLVDTSVALAPELHRALAGIDDAVERLAEEITAAVERLAVDLGIPCHCRVRVGVARDAARILRLTVDGNACRYPLGLEANPMLLRGAIGLPLYEPTGDLADLLSSRATAGDVADVSALVATLATEAVRRHAATLLTPGVVARYAEAFEMEPGRALGEALRLATRLGVSIADGETVREVLATEGENDPSDAAESVAARLVQPSLAGGKRDAQWQLHVHPRYLRALAATNGDDSKVFPDIREALYIARGVRLPWLMFVEDESLPELGFAVRAHSVRTPPFIGLPPGSALIRGQPASPDRAAAPAVDPFDGAPAWVNPGGEQAPRDALSATRVIALVVLGVAHSRAASLVTNNTTADDLQRLSALYPRLGQAAEELVPTARLTRLLRRLVREAVSVRDLGTLAQLMLDQRARSGGLPSDDELLRVVRRGIRSAINLTAAGGEEQLVAHRTPASLEQRLRDGTDLDAPGERELGGLLAAVVSPAPTGVALVTAADVRARLSALVADEQPRLAVLAEDEIDSEASVRHCRASGACECRPPA
jgi:hypothetical protein